MAKRANAIFRFGIDKGFLIPHNADKSIPTSVNMVGDAGALDFSGAAAPAAVPFSIRVDGGTAQTGTIDLDDVGITIGAVTPTQWVAAMTAGLTAASITGFTPSVQAVTGRCMFVKTAPAAAVLVEVYGEAFELAGFGQGYGVKAFVSDELESIAPAPTTKEDVTTSVTNSKGVDTSVIVSGYPKGYDITMIDLPIDYDIIALCTGVKVTAAGVLPDPTPEQAKAAPTFQLWALRRNYAAGENLEADKTGNEWIKYLNCKGSVSGGSMGAGFDKATYVFHSTNVIDSSGVESGASERRSLDLGTHAAIIAALEAI
jgi:hypothetical protein